MAHVSAEMTQCIDEIVNYKKGQSRLDDSIAKLSSLSGLSKEVVRAFLTNVKRDNIVKFPQKFRQKQHGTKLN